MEQNGCWKIAKKLGFVENSSFRESTEAAVRGCSGINLQENISGGVLVTELLLKTSERLKVDNSEK